MKLTLLSSRTCGPCHMLKSKIDQKGLNVDILWFSEPESFEFFRKHNIRAVPRLVIEDGDSVEIIQGIDDILAKIEQNQ
jgi:glutaredoxin